MYVFNTFKIDAFKIDVIKLNNLQLSGIEVTQKPRFFRKITLSIFKDYSSSLYIQGHRLNEKACTGEYITFKNSFSCKCFIIFLVEIKELK